MGRDFTRPPDASGISKLNT